MSYKYIIFDIDDTLLNYLEDKRNALMNTLNDCNIQYDDKLFDIFYKICWDEWYEFGLDNSSEVYIQENYHLLYNQYTINSLIKFKEVININTPDEKLCQLFLNNFSKSCNLNKNVEKICKTLKNDYKLYIASNGLSRVQLSRIDKIKNYFDDFFISESIGNIKPSNKFYSYILNKLSIGDASECLMIGDSLDCDILGANNIGMDTCWYNSKHIENRTGIIPTYEIFDFDEIIKILN